MTRLITLALAAAASITTVSAATAGVMEDSASIAVQVQDLDLASAAGRATLDGRVDGAARKICDRIGVFSLVEEAGQRSCRAAVVKTAYAQLEQQRYANNLTGQAILAALR